MQSRVGEDEIERHLRRERPDVAMCESQRVVRQRVCLAQHRVGIVDAEDFLSVENVAKLAGELTGAAAEIGHAHARAFPDERDQIGERLFALGLEALVLLR